MKTLVKIFLGTLVTSWSIGRVSRARKAKLPVVEAFKHWALDMDELKTLLEEQATERAYSEKFKQTGKWFSKWGAPDSQKKPKVLPNLTPKLLAK